MKSSAGRSIVAAVSLVALSACQTSPPPVDEPEPTREPAAEEAILEETFEGGDTGEFAAEAPESAEADTPESNDVN